MQLPSITAIRCLDASARLLSFTKAAEEVHLTQSAVSHHIQSLEKDLGVELFQRHRSGLRLTVAGQRYWEDTATVLHQLRRAAARAVVPESESIQLNIAVASAFANFWLMPRLEQFVTANPDIILSLSNPAETHGVFTGTIDAAIELCEGATAGVEARSILSLVYQPYVSASLLDKVDAREFASDGAHAAKDLAALICNCPLIRTSMQGAWKGWLREAGIEAQVPAEKISHSPLYAQASLALTAAMNGIGVALLPRYIAHHAVEAGQLLRLSAVGWNADRAYHLRWPAGGVRSSALVRFEDWLVTQAEAESA